MIGKNDDQEQRELEKNKSDKFFLFCDLISL